MPDQKPGLVADIVPPWRRWRIINRPRLKVQLQFELRDVWIGCFWRVSRHPDLRASILHLYVCLLPLFPLHVSILREEPAS
jgi:hypothetical protein